MTRPGVTVAMLGARMHYAVPRILHRAGSLEALVTDIYLPDGGLRAMLSALEGLPGNHRGLRALLSRKHDGLAGARIEDMRGLALGAWLRRVVSRDRGARRAVKSRSATGLAQAAGRHLRRGGAVYAFQGAALESFRRAAPGTIRLLEQSIAARPHAEAILRPECARWGDWFTAAGRPRFDADAIERSRAEWALADRIFAASDFVRESLIVSGVPARKIKVVPYGVDLPSAAAPPPSFDGVRPLRVLFPGNADLRKGIHHLLSALDHLPPGAVELRVAGQIGLRPDICARFASRAAFLGRVPRREMEGLYRWADVVALPSLVEGSATVSYEALAQGRPLVVTPNAGALLRDGREGTLVPAGETAPLAAALQRYLDAPDLLQAHAAGARAAADRVSFERYAADLIAALHDVVPST